MARKRTAPRKRRTTAAPSSAQAAPAAPTAPQDTRLTNQALRAHMRKSKGPVFDILNPFRAIKEEAEDTFG